MQLQQQYGAVQNKLDRAYDVRRPRGVGQTHGVGQNELVSCSEGASLVANMCAGVRGALRDEKQHPAEGTVVVFADDGAKWREGPRAVRTTRADPLGLFTFKGLPAGDYFLVALDSVQEGQWYDPEFLESLKDRATRVAIADAESKQVDLVLRK